MKYAQVNDPKCVSLTCGSCGIKDRQGVNCNGHPLYYIDVDLQKLDVLVYREDHVGDVKKREKLEIRCLACHMIKYLIILV